MPTDHPRLPPLDRLAVFDAAARHLSFTRAAAERFITQSAVSRQIAALEDELGRSLFRRKHRALELTDDGRRLADAVAQAIAGVREAVHAIRSPARREVISITTTPGMASLWLIPRLQGFIAGNPGIDVRIDATHELRSLAGDGFELAIRYAPLARPQGTRLFGEAAQPMCAPALLKAGPRLAAPADLRGHTLLQVAMPAGSGMPTEWDAWLQAMGMSHLEPAAVLTFTSYDNAVAAAVGGQGVVLGRRPLVDRLVRERRLVPLFKGAQASPRGYFLVEQTKAARRPAVRALADWIIREARAPG
jgi:DNA-binding transcriptional LysR family regulator